MKNEDRPGNLKISTLKHPYYMTPTDRDKRMPRPGADPKPKNAKRPRPRCQGKR